MGDSLFKNGIEKLRYEFCWARASGHSGSSRVVRLVNFTQNVELGLAWLKNDVSGGFLREIA